MIKRILTLLLGLFTLPLCFASCSSPATANDTACKTDVIPDPARIDFSTFSAKLFKASFSSGNSSDPKLTENGVLFIGNQESRDPSVSWNVSSMFKAAGYGPSSDGKSYVPFTPEEKKVVVFKIQAEWGGVFEMFYATEDRTEAAAEYSIETVYGGDSEFFGERVSQYIVFDATDEYGWRTRFNDSFRLDYTDFLQKGDSFLLEKAAFCENLAEAEAFIAADKEAPAPKPAVAEGYYVCLYEDRLHIPDGNVRGSAFSSLEDAISFCDLSKQYGTRVANEKGEILYTPYSLLGCNLLREGCYIVNYAREQEFKYGDSCTNPATNHRPMRTSCDRLIDWIVYRAGFIYGQPKVQGCVVATLGKWCEKQGFTKITDIEDLKAGDIVFVRPASDGGPQHVFMLASDPKNGNALRYDHGSDTRIMNPDQPTYEPVSYADAPFVYAYRPVSTEKNNIFFTGYAHSPFGGVI